jgi:hypothetical protein
MLARRFGMSPVGIVRREMCRLVCGFCADHYSPLYALIEAKALARVTAARLLVSKSAFCTGEVSNG